MKSVVPPLPDAVIFDLDGLLLDSEPLQFEAYRQTLGSLGVMISERQYMGFVGHTAQQNLRRVLGSSVSERLVDAACARRDETYDRLLAQGCRAMQGATDLVETLHAEGIPLAVASSSCPDHIRRGVESLGLAGRFAAFASGHEVRRGKPDPAVYRLALGRLGKTSLRCIALEDSHSGVCAATAVPLITVAVPNRFTMQQDLSSAARVLDSLSDITLPLLTTLLRESGGLD
jgi:HAD superfamily hydrolase (TIGR01509 family)